MDPRAFDRPIFSFEFLPATLERYGDATALIEIRDNDLMTHSYGDLATRVGALARGLMRQRMETGERVGLMAPNSAAWIIARLAIAAAGAVPVAIDDLADADETAMNIRTSGLRRLFTVRAHIPVLQDLSGDLGTQLILMDDDAAEFDAALSLTGLSARHNGRRLPPLAPDAPAMLVHTSGTTGSPRPFLLTNRNIEVNVHALADTGLLGPHDRVLLPLPLHHVYPFVVGLLVPFAIGATVVLPEAATGPKIVRALELTGATTMIGVPRLYEALVAGMEAQAKSRGRLPERLFAGLLRTSIAARRRFGASPGRILFPQVHRRLGRLRLLVSAGAKLEEEVIWKLEGLGFQTLSGYGLAETASAFTGNLPRARRIGSEGKPLGNGQVRIADPGPEGIGEIQLQGPAVFDGYLDNPEANRAVFTEDGWFRTGDLGRLDADGYVYVEGRLKELIVLGGGKNVFPEEVEKHYGFSPFIKEVAVLERNGGLVALVVPDTAAIRGSPITSIEAVVRVTLAEAAKTLSSHQRLSGFAIARQSLPRTRLGKYQRHLLLQLYEEALAGRVSASQTSFSEEDQALLARARAAAAWRVLQTRYGSRGLTLDSDPQLDLGIDSLEWLSLGLELESAVGVRIAEQEFAEVSKVRDLLRRIEATAEVPAQSGEPAMLARDEAVWLAPNTRLEKLIGRVLYGAVRGIARIIFRLRVNGLEHLPGASPYLIVANHVSDLDPGVLAASLPFPKLRSVFWSGERSRLFNTRVKRRLCRIAHIFPVDERAPRATLAMAGRVLAGGHSLVWFPESWRSPDGKLQRFLPGVGHLLAEQPVPVIPAYIEGTFEAMPRDRSWPRPFPVTVTFGPSLDTRAMEQGQGDTPEERIADGLRQQVARLADRTEREKSQTTSPI